MRKLKNKKGFVSIVVILFLAILIPFLWFLTIDLPPLMKANRDIKNAFDNAAATAVTQINDEMLASGKIFINEEEAIAKAKEVLINTYNLTQNLTSSDKNTSLINISNLEITVINDVENNPTFTTKNGTYTIKNPSVVVYGEATIKTNTTNRLITFKHTGISQALFK